MISFNLSISLSEIVFEDDIDQMIKEFHRLRANDENYSKESTDNYGSGAKKKYS